MVGTKDRWRFVAEEAKLQFAFVRWRIVLELGSLRLLERVAGREVAADLLLSARMFRGAAARELGVVSRAVALAWRPARCGRRYRVVPREASTSMDDASEPGPARPHLRWFVSGRCDLRPCHLLPAGGESKHEPSSQEEAR